MNDICLPPDRLEALLTEINRHRALTDDETDLLEAVIRRGHRATGVRLIWTPKLEAELKRAYHRPSGVRRFAERHNITPQAAYDKLNKLRKAKRTRQAEQARGEG